MPVNTLQGKRHIDIFARLQRMRELDRLKVALLRTSQKRAPKVEGSLK